MITFRRVYAALITATAAAAACGGDVATNPNVNDNPDSSQAGDTSTTMGDSSTAPDTSTPLAPLPCGMATCDPSTQVCCVTFQPTTETCIAIGGPCMGGTLACSSSLNCTGGEVCCLDYGMGGASTTCKPSCLGGFQEPQLCASDAECKAPDTCRMIYGGYKACAPPFDGGFPKFDGGFPKDAGGPG